MPLGFVHSGCLDWDRSCYSSPNERHCFSTRGGASDGKHAFSLLPPSTSSCSPCFETNDLKTASEKMTFHTQHRSPKPWNQAIFHFGANFQCSFLPTYYSIVSRFHLNFFQLLFRNTVTRERNNFLEASSFGYFSSCIFLWKITRWRKLLLSWSSIFKPQNGHFHFWISFVPDKLLAFS